MASTVAYRPATNSTGTSSSRGTTRRPSLSSFPSSRSVTTISTRNGAPSSGQFSQHESARESDEYFRKMSTTSQHSPTARRQSRPQRKKQTLKSQYPADSSENHVEYILVASFDIDRGSVMEHQYPGPISGDEHMLAELMLPDQAHVRSQDWTIFFLHKDNATEEEEEEADGGKRKRRREEKGIGVDGEPDGMDDGSDLEDEDTEDEDDGESLQGPPLIYVLNLVNTKQDHTLKRGAVCKAMAICTRHSFLHIYKPLLLLALEEYFRTPTMDTLASLYNAVNSMDLSLMPKLSLLERQILQTSDAKDLFLEKFEQMIQQKMAQEATQSNGHQHSPQRFALPRDTHELESRVLYNSIPIPIKVPTAISPETVGDFSLIKLIQTFSAPHAMVPQPFALHPHLTTSGAYTHPIIVLVNALLTQKRIIFLGHNRPSGEVAEAVLAACALASGGILRGFTRHAFPYTDLTKIDDLLKVPGFIAGVTNPAFANHPEWWDLLCDLPTGRMKISNKIESAPVTQGLTYFQGQNPSVNVNGGISAQSVMSAATVASVTGASLVSSSLSSSSSSSAADVTGDNAFMSSLLESIASRHGENAIRSKWRSWVLKFTRIAAAFEETVFGTSALYIGAPEIDAGPFGVSGHGYVWPDEASKMRELAGNVHRIEGWRNTRSYYGFMTDCMHYYTIRPIKGIDLHHQHDRLKSLRLSQEQTAAIYTAFGAAVGDADEICQLLTVLPSDSGLFYISLGLFHPRPEVRQVTVGLLERILEHPAGRHFWSSLGRFAKLAFFRIKREGEVGASRS